MRISDWSSDVCSSDLVVDYGCIPSAVFSLPPMAGVGLTEAQARNTLGSVKIYTSDFRAMKNVIAERNERGLYKMICDAETGQVEGHHMIGPEAPAILQAAAVAEKAGRPKKASSDTGQEEGRDRREEEG